MMARAVLLVEVLSLSLSLGQRSGIINQRTIESEPPVKHQPDDVMSGKYDDMRFDDGWLCTRECRLNDARLCYYTWSIEQYNTMNSACGNCPNVTSDCFLPQCITADGFEKSMLSVDRMLPGPSIQVCKGDTVVVEVTNKMPGRSTSLHWHGLQMRGTPWMDGVPYLTQCPIDEDEKFRYRFKADESGTSFWHAHGGLQKADGVLGSLIVRDPDSENPLRCFYDFDLPSHVVVIEDWMHAPATERLPGFFRYRDKGHRPASYIINGKGVKVVNKTELVGNTPLAEFRVRQGYRYRFRLIGASCLSCPYHFTVQDHKLLVITTDRNPIEPVIFDSIVLNAAERYDVVIEAMLPINAYYMYVEGLGDCDGVSQVAVLIYEGGPSRPSVPLSMAFQDTAVGYMLNPVNSACDETSLALGCCISQLSGRLPTPPQLLRPAPDIRVLLTFNFHLFEKKELFYSGTFDHYFVTPSGDSVAGQINNISYTNPPSPLLTQLFDVPPETFCHNSDCKPDKICECTNIIRIPLNSLAEVMLVHSDPPDPSMLTHPFHIHGYDFYVIEQGTLPNTYETPDAKAFVKKKMNENRFNLNSFLPMKDTVSIPYQGYSILRIIANNPGFWLLHCHYSFHQFTGMKVVIWVGDYSDIPPPPPGFPKCYNFLNEPLEIIRNQITLPIH